MGVIKVFIAEPSFLLREGIKTLLSQMRLSHRVEETNMRLEKLPQILRKTGADLIIMNPELMPSGMVINRSDPKLSQAVWVALAKDPLEHAVAAQFDFVVPSCASRAELVAQFELIVERVGLPARADESTLSDRETDILKYVALGLTNNEISEKLFISIHTVMTHRKNITRKLGIKTVSGLTVYAILNKLITAEQLKSGF